LLFFISLNLRTNVLELSRRIFSFLFMKSYGVINRKDKLPYLA
jgi:hypothetical protein